MCNGEYIKKKKMKNEKLMVDLRPQIGLMPISVAFRKQALTKTEADCSLRNPSDMF